MILLFSAPTIYCVGEEYYNLRCVFLRILPNLHDIDPLDYFSYLLLHLVSKFVTMAQFLAGTRSWVRIRAYALHF